MSCLALTNLVSRKILRIKGPDCYPYLQGLVCNDLRFLYEPERVPVRKHVKASPNVIGTFMLNAQGRAICDMLIYRTPNTRQECEFTPPGKATEPDELFIECDAKLASGLANTLYGYRVRRKIEVSIEDDVSVWCLYPGYTSQPEPQESIEEKQLITQTATDQEVISDRMTVVSDPRIRHMGMRIISSHSTYDQVKDSIQRFINVSIKEATLKDYTLYRYRLGIGEGVIDHPESDCLPLECNADYLGSVSFDKGCYLGQELTSRIHHTGVVRKRLMPITVDLETVSQSTGPLFVQGTEIIDEVTEKKIGTLRHVVKDRGLALLRFDLLNESTKLIQNPSKARIKPYKPFWWK